MKFKRLTNGILSSNTYIIGNGTEGAVIDPGTEASLIMKEIDNMSLKIKYIILTHAHIDHMLYVDELRALTGAKVAVHEDDASALGDPWKNASSLFGLSNKFSDADILLKDNDILKIGDLDLKIIHTPGHTPGGICILVNNDIFTGDTLFRESIGRTDLGTGDAEKIMDSLKNKLMVLDDNIKVHPGHGTATTIGYERANNPFLY
mgnify:FL=1